MFWGDVQLIISVVAAGIVVGLLISFVILRMRRKTPSFNPESGTPAISMKTELSKSVVTNSPIIKAPESTSQPPIPKVREVDARLDESKNSQVPGTTSQKSEALIELETNFSIATRPITDQINSFHLDVWTQKPTEFNSLTHEIRTELSEAYIDMRIANNVVWMVTEIGSKNQDLITNYHKLSKKVAERLQRIMPVVRESLK